MAVGSPTDPYVLSSQVVRDWLTLAALDYVTYRVAVATAETNQATALTTAEALENNQEATAELAYATQSANAYNNSRGLAQRPCERQLHTDDDRRRIATNL